MINIVKSQLPLFSTHLPLTCLSIVSRRSLFAAMSTNIPNSLPNYVYKILPNIPVYQGTPIPVPADWQFPQTEVDANDGFVHMSTLKQLPGTLGRFYGSDETVQLLKIDYKRLSGFKIVKWETASNGDSFPHLYAILGGEYVRDLKIVARGDGWVETVAKLKDQGWLEN